MNCNHQWIDVEQWKPSFSNKWFLTQRCKNCNLVNTVRIN